MLADALCLWIAVVLSAFGTALVAGATGPDSDAGVSDANHEGAVITTGSRDGWAGQYGRKGRSLAPSASPKSLLLYGSAQATRFCVGARLTRSLRHYSRSLSYLSLTLRCMAPRRGWLGGCAPLHAVRDKKNTIDRSARQTRNMRCVCRETRVDHRPGPSLTSRMRPVFL